MPEASAFGDVGSDIAEVFSTDVGEGLGKGLDRLVVPDLGAATVCRPKCRLDLDRVEDELVCLECTDPGNERAKPPSRRTKGFASCFSFEGDSESIGVSLSRAAACKLGREKLVDMSSSALGGVYKSVCAVSYTHLTLPTKA